MHHLLFRRNEAEIPSAFRLLAVIVAMVGLQACSAGESLKEYVKQGKYDQASVVYNENPEFFAKEEKKFAGDLGVLATALRARLEPDLREGLADTKQMRWPAGQSSWPDLRRRLHRTHETLGVYAGHRILSQPQFSSPLYRQLDAEYGRLERAIENDAPNLFASYDHARGARFFDIFPLELEVAPFLAVHYKSIRVQLRKASSAQLRRFLNFYPAGSDLSNPDYLDLGNIYLRSEARRIAGRSKVGFETYLKALRLARGTGFKPDRNGDFSVALVEIDWHRTTVGHDFGLRYDIDIPASFDKKTASNALRGDAAQSADFVIVAVTTRAEAARRTVQVTRENSTFMDGYSREPNPEYQDARLSMRKAASDLVYLKSEIDSLPPLYRIRDRLKAAEKAKDASRIKRLKRMLKKHQNLRRRIRETKAAHDHLIEDLRRLPQLIDVPIHRDYAFERHAISSSKDLTLTYWVIDKLKKRFLKSTLRRVRGESFIAVAKLHNKDLHRSEIIDASDSSTKIDAWETAPLDIKLSEITNDFLRKNGRAQKFSSLSAIRRDLSRGQ